MPTTKLMQFRYELYQHFNKRADATMDLLDALSCQTNAQSIAALSLQPQFRREYSSVYAAIDESEISNRTLARLAGPHLDRPQSWPFYRLCVDVTPQPRPYTYCLADRSFVYSGSEKQVQIGHQYSTVVSLPEVGDQEKTWVTPLAVTRVATQADKERTGAEQVGELLNDPQLPFGDALVVLSGDTYYSKPSFLHRLLPHENLVVLARVRADRVFYCQPDETYAGRGRRTAFGARFVLADPTTWPEPAETWTTEYVSERGHQRFVTVSGWYNILMRGKRKPYVMPMERHPFTLVRVVVTDAAGVAVFQRPLWLILIGRRRHEVSVGQAYETFQQRFRQEHAFRFLKRRLLLTAFQTPDTPTEEKWWRLAHLAYLQLWVAKPWANALPNPWERYLPRLKAAARSPTMVQRDLGRILRLVGTPALPVKPRGKSPGRPTGYCPGRRPRLPTVRKRPKQVKKRPKRA